MIESIKDLEKLLKLCRKQGVTKITVLGAQLELGELPVTSNMNSIDNEEIESSEQFEGFPDGILSQEELTFYANGGKTEENPYRRSVEN